MLPSQYFSTTSSCFIFRSSCNNNNNSTSLPMSTHRHCTLYFLVIFSCSMNTCSISQFTCRQSAHPNDCYSMHSRTTRTTAKTSIKAKLANKKKKKMSKIVDALSSSPNIHFKCKRIAINACFWFGMIFFFCFCFRLPRK